MQWRIRYMYRCYRLQSVDSIGYVPLRFVAYFLSDDFPLSFTPNNTVPPSPLRKAQSVSNTTLQLTGGFLELHQPTFFFQLSTVFIISRLSIIIYKFCNVSTKVAVSADIRAKRIEYYLSEKTNYPIKMQEWHPATICFGFGTR